MTNQNNDQNRSLLSFQNVRTILSLAYIDSKIPKSTLMKIEIKQVLETVNNEIELLVFRNGGNFLCAISRILQKKCLLLMQELRDFYDNFKNKGIVQPNKRGPTANTTKKNRTLLQSAIPDGDSNIFNTSTASIEELSNQSIQNPRNIASKEKITLPTIITPFRTKVTEFVGSSNLLSNERFSEEIALNSGMADILTSKSSLIKSFEKDRRKSPLFEEAAQGERIDDIPPINLENAEESNNNSNLDISTSSNLLAPTDHRIGEMAGALRNDQELTFKEIIERSKNQIDKKQRIHRTYLDEEITLKEDLLVLNLNDGFSQIQIEEEEKTSMALGKENQRVFHEKLPENLLNKNFLDKISKNLSKVSFSELQDLDVEHPKLSPKEKKPFSFTFQEPLAPLEDNEQEKALSTHDQNEQDYQAAVEEDQRNDFLENERIDERSEQKQKEKISRQKDNQDLVEAVNQKLIKILNELSAEKKIIDFERLHEVTKESYSKAQLFLECLQLTRQDKIAMNQSGGFAKITLGLI